MAHNSKIVFQDCHVTKNIYSKSNGKVETKLWCVLRGSWGMYMCCGVYQSLLYVHIYAKKYHFWAPFWAISLP